MYQYIFSSSSPLLSSSHLLTFSLLSFLPFFPFFFQLPFPFSCRYIYIYPFLSPPCFFPFLHFSLFHFFLLPFSIISPVLHLPYPSSSLSCFPIPFLFSPHYLFSFPFLSFPFACFPHSPHFPFPPLLTSPNLKASPFPSLSFPFPF